MHPSSTMSWGDYYILDGNPHAAAFRHARAGFR
jgi:hypothetical protein